MVAENDNSHSITEHEMELLYLHSINVWTQICPENEWLWFANVRSSDLHCIYFMQNDKRIDTTLL
jgi:hypothetical protein